MGVPRFLILWSLPRTHRSQWISRVRTFWSLPHACHDSCQLMRCTRVQSSFSGP